MAWWLELSDDTTLAAGFEPGTTFHPTFLYESLWNLALVVVLLQIDKRLTLRPPRLLAVYLLGYGVGRFWVEGLRIDRADHLAGLRWNQWVAIAAVVGATVYLLLTREGAEDQPGRDGHNDGTGTGATELDGPEFDHTDAVSHDASIDTNGRTSHLPGAGRDGQTTA